MKTVSLAKKTKKSDSKDEDLLNRILDEKEPFREIFEKANKIDYYDLSSDFVRSLIENCSEVSDSLLSILTKALRQFNQRTTFKHRFRYTIEKI